VTERQYHLHDGKKGAALTVRIIPRARKNEVAEILNDGTIKIRLVNAADDQNLNRNLQEFLAGVLQIPAGRIDVVAGLKGLDKLITVLDLDADALQERIIKKLS